MRGESAVREGVTRESERGGGRESKRWRGKERGRGRGRGGERGEREVQVLFYGNEKKGCNNEKEGCNSMCNVCAASFLVSSSVCVM